MTAIPRGTIRYDIGLNFWDLLKYNLIMGAISIMVVFGVISLIMVPMVLLSLTEPTAFIFMCFFLYGLIFMASLFTLGIMALRAFIHSSMIRRTCSNYLEMREHDIVVHSQMSPLYPEVTNIVPLFLIERVGPIPEGYMRERWRNTPWWMMMNFLHKVPHGGLYNPLTSRKNLIVLSLMEPVMISNRDLSHYFLQKVAKYDSRPVMEILLDIDRRYHGHFMMELEMRKPR